VYRTRDRFNGCVTTIDRLQSVVTQVRTCRSMTSASKMTITHTHSSKHCHNCQDANEHGEYTVRCTSNNVTFHNISPSPLSHLFTFTTSAT